jgi:hypothetical protein
VHRLALLAAVGTLALPPIGAATTAPSLIVTVNVTLTTRAVSFSTKSAARGYYVEFLVRNRTSQRRTFSLATRSITVPARRSRAFAIYFDARGRFRYTSRVRRAVFRGTFRVY